MKLHIFHHPDPVTNGLLRAINRKLNHLIERQSHMSTAEQVAKLATDVDALIAAYELKIADLTAKAQPPAPVADPAIDEIDAKVGAP